MAIQTRGETRGESRKSRQIAANSIQKTMAITFLKDRDGSRRIASQRAFQKTMAITLEVKFEPFLACTILVHAVQFIFSI